MGKTVEYVHLVAQKTRQKSWYGWELHKKEQSDKQNHAMLYNLK